MYKEHIIRRDELYEKVWSKPMVEIAKEYEVSDKAIAKICDKLNIPVPGVGYWQKLEVGKKTDRKKLPDIPPNYPTEHRITKRIPDYDLIISEEAQKRIEEEKLPNNKIIVPEKGIRTHSLIEKTKLSLHSLIMDERLLSSRTEGNDIFKITISHQESGRAFRILNTLLRELEKRYYLVYISDNDLWVKIFGIEIKFILKEKLKRVDVKDPKQLLYHKYDYVPSGVLVLSIENTYSEYGLQKNFTDTKYIKLEDRLNEFIIALLTSSQERIAQLKYREKENQIWEEKKRREREAQENIEIEKRKFIELKRNVKNYHNCNLIREYISKYKIKLLDETLTDSKKQEIMDYMDWALLQADRLDPFVESPTSILDNQNNNVEEDW
jgi:hypothetical protein